MVESLVPILLFLTPFMGLLVLPVLYKFKPSLTGAWTALTLIIAACIAFKALCLADSGMIRYTMGGWAAPFGIEWVLDSLSAFISFIILLLSAIVAISIIPYVNRELSKVQLTFHMCYLLLISGFIGMIMTHDLFNMYVFVEVSSLSGYALVASSRGGESKIASFRYLLIGTLGASLYLLGVGFLYANTGTLNMTDMAERLPAILELRSVRLGIILMISGFAIKAGFFPFHGWMPDAYSKTSYPASCIIAPISTKVACYALIRILFWVFQIPTTLSQLPILDILTMIGIVAIVAGSIMAFIQTDFRRMLAYSSISHLGLIAFGIGLGEKTALAGALLHIGHHAAMKMCLFLLAMYIFHAYGISKISQFSRLRGRAPWILTTIILASFSMIGIPPLAGFFSKWYILLGALQSAQPVYGIVIIFASLLSALYFFRIIEQSFFKPKVTDVTRNYHSRLGLLSVSLTGFCLIALGILSPWIFSWIMHNPLAGF